jgi:hypothetical protein
MLGTRFAYQAFPIDLSVAGTKTFNDACSVINFINATDANGNLALDAKLFIQLGDTAVDAIPMSINALIKAKDRIPVVTFSWPAQPGYQAMIFLAPDDQILLHSPPAKQLVTSSSGTQLSTAAVSVGTAAVALSNPTGVIQSRTIQNLGAADIYIGGATVTTASGLTVPANGGTATIDHPSAPVYAISAAAGNDVRVMTES